jgi:hypothetical protein
MQLSVSNEQVSAIKVKRDSESHYWEWLTLLYCIVQFCIVTLNNRSVQYSQGHKNLTRDYSKFSEANFIDELSELDLCIGVSGCNNPSKYFSMLYNKLHKLINKHAPLVPASKRKAKLYCKPWITKGTRN